MSKIITLQEAGKLLLEAKKIALTTHVSPDGDCLGSSLGLYHFLKALGKEVLVLTDDLPNKSLSFLPGSEVIIRPVEGEIIEVDLHCVIDASSFDRIGICNQVVKAPVLMNIDHHVSNTRFADVLYLDAKAAAVGEIMCDLFRAMGWTPSRESAICFYTAMMTDSGSFRYSCTTSKTMHNAAELLDYGVVPNDISDALDVRSRDTAELFKKVLGTLTFRFDGKVAYMYITNEWYNKNTDTDSFVNYARYIEGVDVAVMFKAVEKDVTRVSMRSTKTDVAAIALLFEGGGHVRAAGATIRKPLGEAIELLMAEVGARLA